MAGDYHLGEHMIPDVDRQFSYQRTCFSNKISPLLRRHLINLQALDHLNCCGYSTAIIHGISKKTGG